MKMKKLIRLFIAGFFITATVTAMTSLAPKNVEAKAATGLSEEEQHLAEVASDAVSIGRDELIVDIQSVTSTTVSKSATMSFVSARLTGWGTPKKNAYVIIDDPDYSGSPSNPSISNTPHPVFNGYTVEITNIESSSFRQSKESTEKIKEIVIPNTMVYGDTFKISNNSILKNSFVFSDGVEPKFENILIPKGITKIEAGAFQNLPDSVHIKVEYTKDELPAGWETGWCNLDLNTNVEFGYAFKTKEDTGVSGNEEDYKVTNIGVYTNYYGELVKTPTDSTNTVYSVINDVNWSKDFDNPVRTDKGLTPPYQLDAYVARIDDSGTTDIVIPEKMTYGSNLEIMNKKIISKTISFAIDENGVYLGNISTIKIPSGIEIIENNAFYNVPDSVTIYCEAASKPDLWGDKWTNAKNVVWGESFTPAEKTCVCGSIDKEMRLGNDATSYILGYKYSNEYVYYCPQCKRLYEPNEVDAEYHCKKCHTLTEEVDDVTPKHNTPLIINYDVINKDTNTLSRTVWQELPLLSEEPTSTTKSYFDSCKSSALSRTFDILLEENEEFDATSLVVYNIFRAHTVQIKGKYVDDQGELKEKYGSYVVPETQVQFKASAKKRYSKEVDFNEVLTNEFTGISTFAGTTVISMKVNKVLPSYWYKAIPQETQEAFSEKLASGEYSIRYTFYNLNNSFYRAKYFSPHTSSDVVVTIPVKTPNPVVILEKDSGNDVSFLVNNSDLGYRDANNNWIADFKPENLKQFEIIGLVVNIHLWNNQQSIKVAKSDVSIRFGSLEVMPFSPSGVPVYKVSSFILVFTGGFTVLYAAIAVALFFYLKNKFKNDEFRRVKPKQYLKTAILGFVGSLIIALTIVFICFRVGKFSNAISVHNPLDVYIVVPGIISIVVIGYFIKFVIDKVKARKKRLEAQKLKLEEDVADDGTN